MKILATLSFMILIFAGFESQASDEFRTEQVRAHLFDRLNQATLEDDADDDLLAFLQSNKALISGDAEMAVAAVILARRAERFDLAIDLAAMAMDNASTSPRLIYELGFTLLLSGDCPRAHLIFKGFVDGRIAAPNWIVTESRRALVLCPEQNLWLYDATIDVGYDDNLGGVARLREVVPEEGSALGVLIQELAQSNPNLTLDPNIMIGEKATAGFWTRPSVSAQHNYASDKTHGLISILVSQRLTSPRGYEATQFNLGWQTETATTQPDIRKQEGGKFVRIRRLDTFYHRQEYGQGRNYKVLGLDGFGAIEWQGQKSYRGGFFYGWHQIDSGQLTTLFPQGIRLRIINPPSIADVLSDKKVLDYPWWLGFEARSVGAERAIDRIKGTKISASIGPFPLGSSAPVTLSSFYDRSRRDAPRPWLKARHRRHQYNLSLTAHVNYWDVPFDVVVIYDEVKSKDIVERDEKLSIFFRFSPIN